MIEEYYIVHRGLDAYVYTHANRAVERFVNETQGIKEYLLWKVWMETRKDNFPEMIPVKLIKEKLEDIR